MDPSQGNRALPNEASKPADGDAEATCLYTIDCNVLSLCPKPVNWSEPDFVCSYSWIETPDNSSIIYVPGCLPQWSQPRLPRKINKTRGHEYRHTDEGHKHEDPFGPMFRSLSSMRPDYDLSAVDVVTNTSSMRTLLRFIEEQSKGKSTHADQLYIQLVGDTLVISRHEEDQNARGYDYGPAFEKVFTWLPKNMQDAASHYRVIRYKFGSIDLVAQYEADAFDFEDDREFTVEVPPGGLAKCPLLRGQRAIRPVLQLTVSASKAPSFDPKSAIGVINQGYEVRNSQIVELKSRQTGSRLNTNVLRAQMWFGRIPKLYTGMVVRESGLVEEVKQRHTKEKLGDWEESHQEGLRKLVCLLEEIRFAMKKQGQGGDCAAMLVKKEIDDPIRLEMTSVGDYAVKKHLRRRHWEGDGSRDLQNPSRDCEMASPE